MASRHRSRYLAAADVPFVVDRNGNTTNVILRDGRVAGTWDVDGSTLLYAAFATLDETALAAAAQRLAGLFPVRELMAVPARPLDEGGQNAFMAPLRRR